VLGGVDACGGPVGRGVGTGRARGRFEPNGQCRPAVNRPAELPMLPGADRVATACAAPHPPRESGDLVSTRRSPLSALERFGPRRAHLAPLAQLSPRIPRRLGVDTYRTSTHNDALEAHAPRQIGTSALVLSIRNAGSVLGCPGLRSVVLCGSGPTRRGGIGPRRVGHAESAKALPESESQGAGAHPVSGHVSWVTCSTYRRLQEFGNHGGGGFLAACGWEGTLMAHECTDDDCSTCGQALDALLAQVDGYAVLVEETGHALETVLLGQLDAIDQVEEALEVFAERHELLA